MVPNFSTTYLPNPTFQLNFPTQLLNPSSEWYSTPQTSQVFNFIQGNNNIIKYKEINHFIKKVKALDLFLRWFSKFTERFAKVWVELRLQQDSKEMKSIHLHNSFMMVLFRKYQLTSTLHIRLWPSNLQLLCPVSGRRLIPRNS